MSNFFKRSFSLLAMALVFAQLQLKAQDNNPISKIAIASPTAASLGKYGDIPVSYHTGIPKIGIPIYTVSAGPLSLPISLSYHAAGLKVQEPASWVGAGWALNAGGVITRSVMGAPDEKGINNAGIETHGHFSDYGYNSYIWNSSLGAGTPITSGAEDWKAVADGYKDGEPDLFFFNFGSYSGKFYFRDDRTPVIVPESDIKIEPDYNPGNTNISIQSFIITTPDGVKYYFGNSPGLTGTAPIEITRPVTATNGISSANTISSWYLNKVSTADDVFSITLSYVPETYGYHTISMFPIDGNATSGTTFGSYHGYDLIKNIVQGVRLSQISFPNGKVNFTSDGLAARTDLSDVTPNYSYDAVNQSAKPLEYIQIADATGTVQKKFKFVYGYFIDNVTPIAPDIQNFAPNLFTDKQRLRLDQVQEISGDNSINKPPYYFTYFSEQVPRRLSFGIDHWGFANGVTSNTTLIPTYTKYQTNQTVNYPGDDRDAHWPQMRAGTIQQINYPTGGYSLFEFEPNTVYNTSTSNVNTTINNLIVHLYGQNTYTNTAPFVTDGTAISMAFTNTSNYPATFTIKNSSNVTVYTSPVTENSTFQYSVTLASGTYQATLSLPQYGNLTGGVQSSINQWQTVTTTNTIIIGGNRIKTITHNDGVTANNIITSYSYAGDNGQTSGILYSRPAYVGVKRNDFVRDIGLYTSTNGFTPYPSVNGCPCVLNACYFKSTCSIRPMANTQGNAIGYAQVKVSQTGNGYSVYKYYGSTGTPPWQLNTGDVAIRTVNTAGCDGNAPSFPYPPVPYDYMRGELQYEAQYNEAGQKLKEKSYTPVYVNSPITTPGFIASYDGTFILGTKYELTTARKTQTQVTETSYDANGVAFTTTGTSYNESPWHHEVTRTNAVNSKAEVLETKIKYAFDFRISTSDNIVDGYTQYNTDCATCLANKNAAIAACTYNDATCLTNAYLNYMHCLDNARANWVTYRRTNFTDPINTFQTYHNTAKANAGAELKPILELQDNFQNSPVETSKWKNGNLVGATFSRFDYATVPSGKVYLDKVQAINLAATSAAFTNAATNATNNSIIKDSRYKDETFAKFYNGNLAEITGKDGVTTSYLWGYNNTLPIAKAIGTNQATLLNAYNAVGGNLSLLRNQFPANTVQLNTYVYTPMKGMVSETDVNGKSISYEYDALQRLLLARDFNNNIVKQYDYKYQDAYDATPTNTTPQWIATGQTRCKPCPQNNVYLTNILQQEEKDNNPNSSSYNTLRWNDIGISNACVSNADWQNTSTPVRCRISNITGGNTGEQEQEQMDMNPCSSTYGQTLWIVVGFNTAICPPPPSCSSGTCSGIEKKCIKNVCEYGRKVYTSTTRNRAGLWVCVYHYHWSDGSNGPDYTEYSSTGCGGIEM